MLLASGAAAHVISGFGAVQKAYRALIQFGQGPTAAWNLNPPFITRIKNGSGTPLAPWRKGKITGIPIAASRLIDGCLSIEDLPEASNED